jgi:hypothetical protein
MSRSFARTATLVATVAAAALAASPAAALAQQARLNFTSSARIMDQPGSGGANLLIDFLFGTPEPMVMGTPTGTVHVVPTTNGLFSPEVAPGTRGQITDLVVSSTGVVGAPITPFLTLGGYTFTLTGAMMGNAFGPISLFDVGTGTSASLGINGTVTGGDFGASTANFMGVFTAQFAGQSPAQVFGAINAGASLPVAISAEFIVAPTSVVPEPSTYALLVTGLGMVGFVGHRRRRATV